MTESEATKTPARLDINPGRTRQRSARTRRRCLLWLVALLVVLIAAWVSYHVARFVLGIVSYLRAPHQALYDTPNITFPSPSVVQPLINDQDTFDIAVTIWARATTGEEEENKSMSDMEHLTILDHQLVAEEKKAAQMGWAMELLEEDYILETPLYSDIVFRGLSFSTKDVLTTIDFRLPTAKFRDIYLSPYDLRASFVLIPSSSALHIDLINYSSYLPSHLKLRPRRPWPFPLGSPDAVQPTFLDEALDSFGISIPLIDLQEVPSDCERLEEGEDANITDGGADIGNSPKTNLTTIRPRVLTRTQLRVIKETRAFKDKEYNKRHLMLTQIACRGIPGESSRPSRLCPRWYQKNGHWETRLDVKAHDPTDGETYYGMVYPPYLDTLPYGAGPLDRIPIPVTRRNCSQSNNTHVLSDPEFMDISWRLSVTSRTPGKMLLADVAGFVNDGLHGMNESHKPLAHAGFELWNGLRGQRFFDNAHPRRIFVLVAIILVCSCLTDLFDLHYWYTRVTTVGISRSAALLRIVSTLLNIGARSLDASIVGAGLINLTGFLDIVLMLFITKLLVGLEFAWLRKTSWIPIIRRVRPSHKERASARIDAQTSWRVKGSILLSLFVYYHFVNPNTISLVPSSLPSTKNGPTGYLDLLTVLSSISSAMSATAAILQLLLNHRSRAFAGRHNSVMVVEIIHSVAYLLHLTPKAVGTSSFGVGLSLAQTLMMVAIIWPMAWQALTLRSVPQVDDDEDEE